MTTVSNHAKPLSLYNTHALTRLELPISARLLGAREKVCLYLQCRQYLVCQPTPLIVRKDFSLQLGHVVSLACMVWVSPFVGLVWVEYLKVHLPTRAIWKGPMEYLALL